MRIGGLASGIDTDSMIRDLMNAERIPLDKLEQQRTKMEWQRDAFRDINKQISELERLITDMRLNSNTINPKKVTSSMEGAVTATGSAAAGNGTFKIAVEKLATNAINTGKASKEKIENFISNNNGETVSFYTYGEADPDKGLEAGMQKRSFEIEQGDTIDSVIKKIQAADKNIRAFYDEAEGQFVMETKRTGEYNTTGEFDGAEIGFKSGESSFFTETFGMKHNQEQGGENAIFHYNDAVQLESKDNRYTLNGMTFTFHDVTGKDESGGLINATLTVTNDVDKAVENITEFVDKYNELIMTLNGTQQEPIYRDFPPLTEQQMEEMSDKQIELWEEKARSGLLRRESIIPSALTSLRSTWSTTVDNDGAFRLMAEIGITTTEDYLDGGMLEIDEVQLREKLEEDVSSVQNLLFNSSEGSDRGLLNRLEDSLETTIGRIEQRAGKGSFTNQMYTMGRELEAMEKRIKAFEDRLVQVEDRYWRQFTAMERAISMMNNQSAMLMNFGGNMPQ
ncbi:flagellar hook-associated protein 2 [Oceanobacillus alkalisoli]|uniref:flagellar hook-associated protein 2 n=1 Tax=Oceanobacillus alkalisoli TaxID=2925113 RepID=UPI001EEF92C6|nr:flagellar hook-associated protein 2 [Oceanobacillus alkalisoli]MCF3943446.1 flagellar hook-associated protein 2 [Oceanobacillus alkalisoli]MCG5104035.1 flagellar hook-associated protein 2 [Oceanobacillus alkalisoli]